MGSPMVVTLGQQYNIGEKPTFMRYTYMVTHITRVRINRVMWRLERPINLVRTPFVESKSSSGTYYLAQ